MGYLLRASLVRVACWEQTFRCRANPTSGAIMTVSSGGHAPLWSLSEKHLKALAQRGSVKAYPKNTVIVNEGDRSDTLFIILSGKVKAYLADEEGKEVLLSTQGAGEYFGEMILDQGPRSASIMTLEPSKFSVVTTE